MSVQSPPAPPKPESDVEAGVIEDARVRQRRHRLVGVALVVAALVAGVLVLGFFGGSGGAGSGGDGTGPSSGSGAGAGAPSASRPFLDAPSSQPRPYWTSSAACPLAAANRYLPPWSGCVTVRRADLAGNGRTDLILLYSRLGHTHFTYPGAPANTETDYIGKQAVLRVVTPQGESISSILKGARAAAILAVAHISDLPGKQIIIQVSEISSGSAAVVYSLYHGQLTPAGVQLGYGGDSGVQAGFDCFGHPARVVQRVFTPFGNLLTAPWQETETTFAWHGPRLGRLTARTFKRHGQPTHPDISVGGGCVNGIGRSSFS